MTQGNRTNQWGVIAFEVEEEFGHVRFTHNELTYLIHSVTALRRELRGSTSSSIISKIQKATHWDMRAIPLFCRFVYKHKLLEL